MSGDLTHPKRCIYPGCPGLMVGQMLTCAPHWSFLEEPMRLALVSAWDALRAEQRAGNVRRATRDAWRRIGAEVVQALSSTRTQLEATAGRNLTASGHEWRRAARRTERGSAETQEEAP